MAKKTEYLVRCSSFQTTDPRNDPLGLPDAPHLRGVQDEGGLALHLPTEAVRVQHLGGGDP